MQFSLQLTASFLKRSYARRMFYRWWAIALAVAVTVGIVTMDWLNGSLSAVSIFALSALAFYAAIAGLAWLRQSRALDAWLRMQDGAPVVYSLTPETVESRSAQGAVQLQWAAFRLLVIDDFDTLLVLRTPGALTLPTAQIPAEALAFMQQQIRLHGGRVQDRRPRA